MASGFFNVDCSPTSKRQQTDSQVASYRGEMKMDLKHMRAVCEIYAEEGRVVGIETSEGKLFLISPRTFDLTEVEAKVKQIEKREESY